MLKPKLTYSISRVMQRMVYSVNHTACAIMNCIILNALHFRLNIMLCMFETLLLYGSTDKWLRLNDNGSIWPTTVILGLQSMSA